MTELDYLFSCARLISSAVIICVPPKSCSILDFCNIRVKKKKTASKMKENQEKQIVQKIKWQIAGWILFILCAVFYITSSLKNNDVLTLIGSVIFLVACIVFVIPLVRSIKKG